MCCNFFYRQWDFNNKFHVFVHWLLCCYHWDATSKFGNKTNYLILHFETETGMLSRKRKMFIKLVSLFSKIATIALLFQVIFVFYYPKIAKINWIIYDGFYNFKIKKSMKQTRFGVINITHITSFDATTLALKNTYNSVKNAIDEYESFLIYRKLLATIVCQSDWVRVKGKSPK